MRRTGDELVLSATDLTQFLCCRHGTALEMAAALGERTRPHWHDPLLEILLERGLEHEGGYVDSLRAQGKAVVDLSAVRGYDEATERTIEAMRAGADVVSQGALRDGRWFGKPDVLLKVDGPSALGPLVVRGGRHQAGAGDGGGDDPAAGRLRRAAAGGAGAAARVLPRGHAGSREPDPELPQRRLRGLRPAGFAGRWRPPSTGRTTPPSRRPTTRSRSTAATCAPGRRPAMPKRHADDHLSIVAGITALQRRELEAAGRPDADGARPARGAAAVQAAAGIARDVRPGAGAGARAARVPRPRTARLRAPGTEEGAGLARLPEPSPGDVFLDLEGDSFAREGGREYLFGVVTIGDGGAPVVPRVLGVHGRRGAGRVRGGRST